MGPNVDQVIIAQSVVQCIKHQGGTRYGCHKQSSRPIFYQGQSGGGGGDHIFCHRQSGGTTMTDCQTVLHVAGHVDELYLELGLRTMATGNEPGKRNYQ